MVAILANCKIKNENHSIKISKKASQNHNKLSDEKIPEKAYFVRDYVKKTGRPMAGYVGGRVFKNLEKRLPIFDENNKKIKYQEWDINKKKNGVNRGSQRLITGSDGIDYYTPNHYKTFFELVEK